MKPSNHRFLSLALMALLSATSLQAAETEIIYSRGDSTATVGTGSLKAETYDVAQHIADRALVGLKVKGLRIAFPFTTDLSAGQAWLSRELPTIKSQRRQEADIASQDFDPKKGYTQVDFAEPYTITEEGLYVGYTFKVAKSTTARKPLVVSGQTTQGGLFLHSSDVYRTAWHDLAADLTDIAIQVVLEGDNISDHAAGVGYVQEFDGRTGEPNVTTVQIVNHGTQGVAAFDYTYELAGQTGSGHVELGRDKLPGIFGRSATFQLQLPAVAEKGAYPVTVDITQVDGFANDDVAHAGQGLANLYHTLPIHRSVVEEYTGTWCGYCPRGYVGLEEMNRLHPDDFIGISYHNRDPMEIMSSGQFPSNVPGFPAAYIDRKASIDAFSGAMTGKVFGIDDFWQHACNVLAPAEVDVESAWTEDSVLTATALVTFPLDRADCPYEVGFILLSDGLTGTGSSWAQANYYAGETGWPSSMDTFTKGGSYVNGLTFNFVIVARSGIAGIENSLLAPIEADVTQSYNYAFDIREVKNTSGDPVVQDKNNLRVVALLFDKETGYILNANKAAAGTSSKTPSAIRQLARSTDKRVRSTVLYDLQGHRVAMPGHGLYLKVETLEDGTVRTGKVLR
ncbi:MAG: hypothetical protein IJ243_08130 [Prevotella sp.]|nr:hypothetical protein [Prevotella sp.]